MSAHTPGPWRFEPSSGGRWYVYPLGETQPLVPNIYVPKAKLKNARMMANARLLAAAPELLAALKAIVSSATDGRDIPEWLTERLIWAESAICKAEGR